MKYIESLKEELDSWQLVQKTRPPYNKKSKKLLDERIQHLRAKITLLENTPKLQGSKAR